MDDLMLPPLPESWTDEDGNPLTSTLYTAYQMREYAKRAAVVERDRTTKLLYQMHELAATQHSYYKHAAIEINRKARSQS